MINSGMPSERISAASFSYFKPVSSNDTPEGRELNRRIEIVIVPDMSALPGYEELKKLNEDQNQKTKENKMKKQVVSVFAVFIASAAIFVGSNAKAKQSCFTVIFL